MENPGILSLVQFSDDEKDLFLKYLKGREGCSDFDVLDSLFDVELLKFLDVFSGQSIKVPKRSYIEKVVNYVKIYKYCEARDFSEESIRLAAKIFDKRKGGVRRAIDIVNRKLKKLEELEEEELEEEELEEEELEEEELEEEELED